jgi:hypothetical protein
MSMFRLYVLDVEGKPLPMDDLLTWGEWFERTDTTIALDRIDGDVTVSTVFLGLDLRMFGDGPPLLYETMIFGGPRHHYCRRTSTKTEALKCHRDAVQMAIDGRVSEARS